MGNRRHFAGCPLVHSRAYISTLKNRKATSKSTETNLHYLTAFGFTVKKQIEEAKKEIKENFKEETQQIRNELVALGISNRLTSAVYVQAGQQSAPPDTALPDITNQVLEALKQFQQESGIKERSSRSHNVAESTMFAFEQRYLIEREVKRIWGTVVRRGDYQGFPTFSRMVEDLVLSEQITPELAKSLRQVYQVASAAIHGVEPESEKEKFLKEVAPEIVGTLSSIRWSNGGQSATLDAELH